MLKKIEIRTQPGENLIDITEDIQSVIRRHGVTEGVCVVSVPHTTAGLIVNSGIDTKTLADIIEEVDRLVPTRVDYHHQYDTPRDAAGHIKSVLVGSSLSLIITDGELLLGHSQSVLFFEFDGPRDRLVWLCLLPAQNLHNQK